MRDLPAAPHTSDARDAIWRPRETAVARSVAQYSRFVGMMKIALPSAAGVLLLLVILLPQFRQDDDRYRIDTDIVKEPSDDSLSMTNARYYGTDDKGQPYSVVATSVRQHAKDEDTIELATPSAEISRTDGTFLSAKAKAGLYNRGQQQLDLSGGVSVAQDNGYSFTTDSARVNLEAGSATGAQPVSGDGPLGTLEAQSGFDLSNHGRTVNFKGPSRLVMTKKATASGTKADEAKPAGAPQ